MVSCIYCNSTHIQSRGISSSNKRKYQCQDCMKWFSEVIDSKPVINENVVTITSKSNKSKYVITSAQSNTPLNELFFKSLLNYVEHNNSELIVIPIRYNNPNCFISDEEICYDERLQSYLTNENIVIHKNLKVLCNVSINACAVSPLSGLDSITKGVSTIIGHNQLAMKTLPVQSDDIPVLLTTTGTLSEKNYSTSKQGYKAEFNHSNSAIAVELDDDIFHLRHLNFDGSGFYDLEYQYTDKVVKTSKITAIVTGDEHTTFADPLVKAATYTNVNSIVKLLNPEYIVRHDLLDCYSVSHHHKHNIFTQYAKFISGTNNLETELNNTINYVVETTPENVDNLIVASNHNDHLLRWLNECVIVNEPWNALLYHSLMYKMLDNTHMTQSKAVYPNPFELYAKDRFTNKNTNVRFLSRNQTYKIYDIEIASHGDRGNNGSRGSRLQFANLPSKTIIGHSHSPGIEKGCYQVGTSSFKQLEYNSGASSWLNTHCLIYPNGKRQLINIINGKWRK